jgi:hypothetical protein
MSKTSHDSRNLLGAFDSFSEDSLRALSSGEGSIPVSGYAARFNEVSEDLGGWREIISPGAFDGILEDPDTDVRALINHEGVPLARYKGDREENTLRLSVDEEGLRYSFDLNVAQPESRALASAMSRGDIDQSSFRFQAREGSKFSQEPSGIVRTVFRVTSLRDISVVTFPAYPSTSAEVKRSLEEAQETLKEASLPDDEDSQRAGTAVKAAAKAAAAKAAAAKAVAEADAFNATRIGLD